MISAESSLHRDRLLLDHVQTGQMEWIASGAIIVNNLVVRKGRWRWDAWRRWRDRLVLHILTLDGPGVA